MLSIWSRSKIWFNSLPGNYDLTTLYKKLFENIVWKGENAGHQICHLVMI